MSHRISGLILILIPACQPPRAELETPSRFVHEAGPGGPIGTQHECTVTRIVDGDTLDCDLIGRIRLIGVDSPERAQEPFGALATDALGELLPLGTLAIVEEDVEPEDRYGRRLGYLWADGVLVNWVMVRNGYAVALTYPPNVQYVDQFVAAQGLAAQQARGLWAVDAFACEPRDFRRRACR